MKTIADVYEANARVRERLIATVSNLGEEDSARPTGKGDWTVASIVEHLALVENSMTRIAAKLLRKAADEGTASDSSAGLSVGFMENTRDVESRRFKAPEVVQPKGGQTIAESLAKLRESREMLKGLQERFETVDGRGYTFPHPAFGDMTAQDWLFLIGAHESRHIDQIERMLGGE